MAALYKGGVAGGQRHNLRYHPRSYHPCLLLRHPRRNAVEPAAMELISDKTFPGRLPGKRDERTPALMFRKHAANDERIFIGVEII